MTNEDKFNSCKHRGETEEEIVVQRCACEGGDYTRLSWRCYRINITDLNPGICGECELYESRSSEQI